MRFFKILAATAIAITFAVGVWWLFSYSPSEFHGAAPMLDTGVFSYPRYHAALGDMPLAEAGDYTLKFSGLPSEQMALQLYVVGGSDANGDLLRSLTTELSANIVDSQGKVLCSANGTPSQSDSSARWVLMSSGIDAAYWHDHCIDVAFARHTNYTLHLSISNVDQSSPRVLLRATLEGGGNELP